LPKQVYVETFDSGLGGWTGYEKHGVLRKLEIKDGVVTARSPFMLDANHAPPGAGYLNILAFLLTTENPEATAFVTPYGGKNNFVAGGYPTDFTNARITFRMKGEIDFKGSQLVLLAQSKLADTTANAVLTGQPIKVTKEWSDQTITLVPDEKQWTPLGGRWNKVKHYGYGPIKDILRDLNHDIILVLFPVNVVPVPPIEDMHNGVPGRDYDYDRTKMPTGYLSIDTVTVEFA